MHIDEVLFRAVWAGELPEVKRALSAGANPLRTADNNEVNAFLISLQISNTKILKEILEYGKNSSIDLFASKVPSTSISAKRMNYFQIAHIQASVSAIEMMHEYASNMYPDFDSLIGTDTYRREDFIGHLAKCFSRYAIIHDFQSNAVSPELRLKVESYIARLWSTAFLETKLPVSREDMGELDVRYGGRVSVVKLLLSKGIIKVSEKTHDGMTFQSVVEGIATRDVNTWDNHVKRLVDNELCSTEMNIGETKVDDDGLLAVNVSGFKNLLGNHAIDLFLSFDYSDFVALVRNPPQPMVDQEARSGVAKLAQRLDSVEAEVLGLKVRVDDLAASLSDVERTVGKLIKYTEEQTINDLGGPRSDLTKFYVRVRDAVASRLGDTLSGTLGDPSLAVSAGKAAANLALEILVPGGDKVFDFLALAAKHYAKAQAGMRQELLQSILASYDAPKLIAIETASILSLEIKNKPCAFAKLKQNPSIFTNAVIRVVVQKQLGNKELKYIPGHLASAASDSYENVLHGFSTALVKSAQRGNPVTRLDSGAYKGKDKVSSAYRKAGMTDMFKMHIVKESSGSSHDTSGSERDSHSSHLKIVNVPI